MSWKPPNLPAKGSDAYDRYIESMVRRSFASNAPRARIADVKVQSVSDDPAQDGYGIIQVVIDTGVDGSTSAGLSKWLDPLSRSMRMIGDPLFHDGGGRGSYIVSVGPKED